MPTRFTTEAEYDALNRITLATHVTYASGAADSSATRPVYNEANLLQAVYATVRGGAERAMGN